MQHQNKLVNEQD